MELFDQLTEIHNLVHKNFTYKEDKAQYKVDEKWVMPPDNYDGTSKIVGDCEDFALACRTLCRKAGLKTRLIYCEIKDGGHCVMECEGWILDNRFKEVKTRDALESTKHYKWVLISGFEPGDVWSSIKK